MDDARLSSLADLSTVDDIQELETRLADLPELERRQIMDRVIRTRQAKARRLADAARHGEVAASIRLDQQPAQA